LNQENPAAKTPKFSEEYILLHTFAHFLLDKLLMNVVIVPPQ